MTTRCRGLLAAWVFLALAPLAPAADNPAALSGKIEELVAAKWAAAKVEPAPLADDAEFLRRVYLDLTGKIPPVADARAFLDDPAPDKRRRLVERLLDSPAYVTHFTNVFRSLLLPEIAANFQLRALVPTFEIWIRKQLAENAGYDRIVRGILTTSLMPDMSNRQQPGAMTGPTAEATPAAYFMTKDVKPEVMAASTARQFLGIRLECAQCHDHPTAAWKREQFWSFAAFFAGLSRQGDNAFGQIRELGDKRELQIPGKETVVQALFLDGREPQFQYKVPARATLASWITSPDNPYFARAAVNRLWAHFLGLGFVEPVDDLGGNNPPSHTELLDELSRQFVAHQFDLKYLIRGITLSRVYQLSSAVTTLSQNDARLFARMAVKGMSPEQLFDSVMQATGYRDATPISQRGFAQGTPRGEFLAKFASQENRTETQTTILQALYLMNGNFVAGVTSVERSELLAAVADSPFLDPAGQVETLYLATLSRRPRPDEAEKLLKYVNGGGAKKDPKTALGDVFWALLNSPEFILNH
jgi:hypothetical protein